jgi:uncharacterized membrane protein
MSDHSTGESGAVSQLKRFPLCGRSGIALGPWQARAFAALAGFVTYLALPMEPSWVTRVVIGWDVAVLVLVAEGWWVILRSDAERTRAHAASDDPGRLALLAVSVTASFVSLLAAVTVIRVDPIGAHGGPDWLHPALGLVAIVAAWTLLHTAYTLHYARLFYANPETENSLAFFGGPPDAADFAYFAFGVGMTFQVPDVNVLNRQMRRTVLAHQLLSFVYNTAILALVVNLIAGRL